MSPDVAVHMFGVAIGAGLLVGAFVSLVNSWLP